jgi:hypothetical protein
MRGYNIFFFSFKLVNADEVKTRTLLSTSPLPPCLSLSLFKLVLFNYISQIYSNRKINRGVNVKLTLMKAQ